MHNKLCTILRRKMTFTVRNGLLIPCSAKVRHYYNVSKYTAKAN